MDYEQNLKTDVERDAFEFAEQVRRQALGLVGKVRHREDAVMALLSLCEQCGRFKRRLTGEPEPDPDVDYDDDRHWDGTPLQRGEKRLEKGEVATGYDVRELLRLREEDGE